MRFGHRRLPLKIPPSNEMLPESAPAAPSLDSENISYDGGSRAPHLFRAADRAPCVSSGPEWSKGCFYRNSASRVCSTIIRSSPIGIPRSEVQFPRRKMRRSDARQAQRRPSRMRSCGRPLSPPWIRGRRSRRLCRSRCTVADERRFNMNVAGETTAVVLARLAATEVDADTGSANSVLL